MLIVQVQRWISNGSWGSGVGGLDQNSSRAKPGGTVGCQLMFALPSGCSDDAKVNWGRGGVLEGLTEEAVFEVQAEFETRKWERNTPSRVRHRSQSRELKW